MKQNTTDWLLLPVFIAAGLVVAGLGMALMIPALDAWYGMLQKPAWAPSHQSLARLWPTLYVLVAVAAWLVWRQRRWGGVSLPLTLFAVQVVLHVAWPGFFFAQQAPEIALAEILFLWVITLATLLAFWRVTALAGLLFFPSLLWVTFATALNYTVWRMSR